MRLVVELKLVPGGRSETLRVGGRSVSCNLDAARAMPGGARHARRGAGIAGAPSTSLAVMRPRRHDRGFAVRPSDDPPDELPDDDPPDDDPLDDEGVGDGADEPLGRSRAVAPVEDPPGCV